MPVYRRSTRIFIKYTCIFLFTVIFATIHFGNRRNEVKINRTPPRNQTKSVALSSNKKYILLWTSAHTSPFQYLRMGNLVFVEKKCKWTNCYVTNNRNFLGDYSEFEVIAFHGPELLEYLTYGDLPNKRSANQKYVFANIEAAALYPLCTNVWNNYFNWTWTYKLNSDALWGYFVIRNASKHVIGPNQNMHWLSVDKMDDIDDELKVKLKNKSKTVAWFVSNCISQSSREHYVLELRKELRKFKMEVTIYGKCGEFSCPKEDMPRCLKILEDNYYFYLAFENSLSEDYVTEKILYALNHNTVPIVLGGANYTRFMPNGIYLNANKMDPRKLANKIYQIIKKPLLYYKFFRWKKYYSYHLRHESPYTDDYCNFCAMLNDKQLMKKTTIYENLNKWWTGDEMDRICHPSSQVLSDTIVDMASTRTSNILFRT
ncbi:alpha-(1,3)-fucosyltransferase C-like [Ostrinia nubilalis]|uniref:alpha-(1,3)-fucosyltransferase C-like n=1 Tax=Ostrinia nubilalis TaxID=29057 RepID=UPI00308229AD